MHWIPSIDLALFRLINDTLSNPVFDRVMPFASQNKFFFPVLIVAGLALLWKNGRRARLCLLITAIIIPAGDGLITNTLKHALARPRPFVTLENVRVFGKIKTAAPPPENMVAAAAPAQLPNHNSLPSAHVANWFAGTMIFLVYYRRSWRFMLPLALTVAFSRVYNGVHYPSDVLVGAILGAGYAPPASGRSMRCGSLPDENGFQSGGKKFPRSSTQTPAPQTPNSKLQTPMTRTGCTSAT